MSGFCVVDISVEFLKATPTPLTPAGGGGWTTVGSGGKPNPTPSTPRQITASGSSNAPPQTSRVVNGTPTRASTAPSQALKASSSSKPVTADGGPVPPSPDFMKWLREAVRGFNAGFNSESSLSFSKHISSYLAYSGRVYGYAADVLLGLPSVHC